VRVTCDDAGAWEIQQAPTPSGSYAVVFQTVSNPDFTTTHFGFQCNYASVSRSSLYNFGDITIASTATVAEAGATPTNDIITRLQQLFPTAKQFLFESDQAIPFTEKRRKDIQLKKNGLVVIEHLSNPDHNSNGIKIINTIH
jgi:hypothetical protein